MAEYIVRNIQLAISKDPETAINIPYVLAADFVGALMEGRTVGVPSLEKIDDGTKIGGGNEFRTQTRNNYWGHTQFTLGEDLNVDIAARLFARALGGTVVSTIVAATTAYDHAIIMQTDAAGRLLPLTTVIASVGGYDFIYASMAVDQFSVSQDAAGVPKFSAGLVGTGYWLDASAQTVPLVTPQPAVQRYMHGAASTVTLNDGGAINLTTEGKLRGFNVQLNNNIRRDDRRPGDPFFTAGNVDTGAYVNHLNRGTRDATIQLTISLDQNRREWDWMRNNTTVTALKITCKGQLIVAGPEQFEFEVSIPKSYVRNVTSQEQNDDMLLVLEFTPLKDTVTGGIMTGRVRNTAITLA